MSTTWPILFQEYCRGLSRRSLLLYCMLIVNNSSDIFGVKNTIEIYLIISTVYLMLIKNIHFDYVISKVWYQYLNLDLFKYICIICDEPTHQVFCFCARFPCWFVRLVGNDYFEEEDIKLMSIRYRSPVKPWQYRKAISFQPHNKTCCKLATQNKR